MKTIERVLNGQVIELITNNSWEVSQEENPPESLELLKARKVEKWNSHGCAIIKDDEGMSIVCKPALFGATHSQNATVATSGSTKTPSLPESFWDDLLANQKGLKKETIELAQAEKNKWLEVHKKEEEAKQRKAESIKKLAEGLSKEDIMALLGL